MDNKASTIAGPTLPEETLVLMADWWRRARESQFVHYEGAGLFSKVHLWIGGPAALLATAAGAEAFSSLARQTGSAEKIIVGSVALVAGALAAFQTFLGPAKRADEHRATAAGYASVRRRLEQLKALPPSTVEVEAVIDEVRLEMDRLAKSAPEMPPRAKKRAEARLKEKGEEGIFPLVPRSDSTQRLQ